MTAYSQHTLSTGWSFKDSEDAKAEAWSPVPVVPSVIHQDLQANNKYGLELLRLISC